MIAAATSSFFRLAYFPDLAPVSCPPLATAGEGPEQGSREEPCKELRPPLKRLTKAGPGISPYIISKGKSLKTKEELQIKTPVVLTKTPKGSS